MKKRLVVLTVVFCMVMLSLVGCASNTTTDATATESTEASESTQATESAAETAETAETTQTAETDILVGMSITNMDVYNTVYLGYIEEQLDALGIEYLVTDGENDVAKQLSDVESLITAGCDVIVMNPLYKDSSGTCTTAINEAGIPLIVRDQMTDDGTCNCYVGNPPDVQCQLLADWVIENYLDTDPDFELNICACVGFLSDQCRWKPMLQALEDRGYGDRVNVLDVKEGLWNMDDATTLAEDWLQTYDNINFFFAENDEMAVACVNVLKAAGKDPADYIITGFNGDDIAKEAITAGEMSATMLFDQRIGAQLIVQAIQLLANGYEFTDENRDLDMVELGAISVMDATNIETLTGDAPEVDLMSYLESN